MPHRQPNSPVFIDLFAGCGGLSLGLEMAGFFPLFVNELNSDAMQTYLANRERLNPLLSTKFHEYDIKTMVLTPGYVDDLLDGVKSEYGIDGRRGEIDLLVGGPPCQGFSGIGHRRSYAVDKQQLPSNHLYEDMANLVSRLRPRMFLFENVRGLLVSKWTANGDSGEIWNDVQATFKAIPGYRVDHALLRSKDYGVPQNRPRVIMVGVREDWPLPVAQSPAEGLVAGGLVPEASGTAPDLQDLLGDLVDLGYRNGGATTEYPVDPLNDVQVGLRTRPLNGEVLRAGDCLSEQEYANHAPRIVSKFKYMLKHGGDIPPEMRTKKFAQKVLPKRWGVNGPTITATSMPDDYVHFSQPRTLTVREWARLQEFPDWYIFKGKRTTGGIRRAGNPLAGIHEREAPKYTQIGNAVPVKLARALGQHFRNMLDK